METFVCIPLSRHTLIVHALMLFKLFFLFLLSSYCSSQTITNTLYATKNNANDVMSFNIKVNGVNYFQANQVVSQTGTSEPFQFQRNLSDTVQVIFTDYTAFSGYYTIASYQNSGIFDSRYSNFYIVNQCSSQSGCDLQVDAIGTFPTGVTATIYINQIAQIITGFSSGSQTITIQTGDLIYVTVAQDSNQFGMTFTTTSQGTSQGSSIQWYDDYLATQMLIPSVYFISPLNETTVYSSTNAPVQLVSYPITESYTVSLDCNGLITTSTITSNTASPQDFLIPTASASTCYFSMTESGTGFAGLNTIQVSLQASTPTSITFNDNVTGSTYCAGTNATLMLTSDPDAGNFMVQLTCQTASITRVITSNTGDPQNFLIPDNLYGTGCNFSVTYPITASNPPTITVLSAFTVTAPTSINYGESVSFKVDSSGPKLWYTVNFTCSTASFALSGLSTGTSYSLVPALVYGNVEIIANSTGYACTASTLLNIIKPAVYPPATYIPADLPFPPSIYLNSTSTEEYINEKSR